jgi:hypothetical protein
MRQVENMYLESLPFIIDKLVGFREDPFSPKGFILLPNLSEDINIFFENQFKENEREFEKNTALNSHVPFPSKLELKNLLKKNEKLQKVLKDYLIFPSFDTAYFFNTRYDGSASRRSQHWHHDSVGRRLKLFIAQRSDKLPTLSIESNAARSTLKWRAMDDDERKEYKPGSEVENICLTSKDAILMDTNYMHSGTVNNKVGVRNVLVIEYSNCLKSVCRGRVGKRNIP